MSFDRTLIIIPCSKAKERNSIGSASSASASILEDLPTLLKQQLEQARCVIASKARLDESHLLPALDRYTGNFYQSAKNALAINGKYLPAYFLILSGGYGVVRAKDWIGHYENKLKLCEWPKGLLEQVITAYAQKFRLRRAILFAADTSEYAHLLRRIKWKKAGITNVSLYVAEKTKGAQRKAPQALGEGLAAILSGNYTKSWRSKNGVRLLEEFLAP